MLELLESVNYWHWLALGLALLACELLGTAGYLLWLGLSAMVVGALLTVIPMSWQLQWVSFGVFSLVTTWLWWRRQLKSDTADDAQRQLNQKHKQLVGQTFVLDEDFPAGKGRLKVGDSTWSAQSESAIKAGQQVEVTKVSGIILTIKPRDN
ncbi:NfeD family protein [Vibrio brasiliensis]|uniref:NfeD family protein n=1 Tax=Vibrio brasiliensis TaxID=170652 RepID=UPI001EFED7D3|nr:NfeD family protein [Vibrio brasiliensis]MCG9649872.1 NfeD family protein [Vibrio brasiliensis]MCG9726033.1 NfeD family protein [Vibrio brasiliensis]